MMLVFGETGQLAQELRLLVPDAVFLGRGQADLTDPAGCAGAIHRHRPQIVINAAAYTAVDRAEEDAKTAQLVNADAPGAMAGACAELGIPFLHVSTDYVFDGSGDTPRDETRQTGPLGVYGATKLAGEAAIAASGARYVILRTSWVFSGFGSNFVKTMLRLGAERDQLTIVADQIGGPTAAGDIADALLTIARTMLAEPDRAGGIFHFAGAPDVSWADFARQIFTQAGLPTKVADIASSDYPTPAQRPANSRLDCSRISRDFGISRPDWRKGLAKIVTGAGVKT